jgi:hypothetical protein
MMYSQPDPYFDLQYNPGLTLIEFLPEGLGEKDVYDKLFANTDYIIINAGNPELDTLVEHNVQHTTVVEGMTFVIQLVPKTQRIIND